MHISTIIVSPSLAADPDEALVLQFVRLAWFNSMLGMLEANPEHNRGERKRWEAVMLGPLQAPALVNRYSWLCGFEPCLRCSMPQCWTHQAGGSTFCLLRKVPQVYST